MTVASAVSRVSYSGNGSTTAFAVPFYFLENSHLTVILTSGGTSTTQTITTNYTVTGAGNPAGGTVNMLVAPPSGSELLIFRSVAITQETDYQANDPFPAESHERALDKLTMLIQQNADGVTRSIKAPVTDPTTVDMTLPSVADRLGRVLTFNATTGNPEAGIDVSEFGAIAELADDITTVAGIADDVTTVAGIDTEVTTVSLNSDAVEAIGRDLTGQAITLDYGDLGAVNNPAYPQGVLGAIYDNLDEIALVAAVDDEIFTVAGDIDAIVAAAAAVDTIATAVDDAEAAQAAAEAAQSAAETAETNAETAETNAAASASAAASSASAASTSASNASSSATAAGNAQTAAEAARDATLTAYDNFDDRYLGAKATAPTLDNDGNALVAGSLYFDTVAEAMKVYTGSAWVAAYISGTGYLAAANNLSDLADAATARTNLGVAIGTNVLAYDSNLQSFVTAFTVPTTDGTIGQALITDGAGTISFGDVDALPDQSGNSGKYLTTDGTNASWAVVSAGDKSADGGFANSVYTAAQSINGGTA